MHRNACCELTLLNMLLYVFCITYVNLKVNGHIIWYHGRPQKFIQGVQSFPNYGGVFQWDSAPLVVGDGSRNFCYRDMHMGVQINFQEGATNFSWGCKCTLLYPSADVYSWYNTEKRLIKSLILYTVDLVCNARTMLNYSIYSWQCFIVLLVP